MNVNINVKNNVGFNDAMKFKNKCNLSTSDFLRLTDNTVTLKEKMRIVLGLYILSDVDTTETFSDYFLRVEKGDECEQIKDYLCSFMIGITNIRSKQKKRKEK